MRVLLAAALLLAACGGAPVASVIQVEAPLSPVVRAHKALLVTSTATREDLRGDAETVGSKVARKLEKLPYFAVVLDEAAGANSEADIELSIRVTEVVKVTPAEREAKGDGAGEVKVVADLRLIDRSNHAVLGKATVFASGYRGPTGGTTADAEESVAEQIFQWFAGRAPQ